ncbi:MAG: Polyketide cyclase/dehydrase [Mucilaginibacter sp.]|nr:Polyketide cyclase/dehydrase [Mucilaginibacter sp.]MDB5016582.1 Polyketide cyclase/dehydrase [Mucilaginibacter sp.]
MKGIKFTETIEVDCTPETVFDFTQDYGKRLIWDTFLKRADLIDGALKADKGVKALCVAKNGLGMVTEYITFNRPTVTAIKMIKGPYLFKSFLGSWTFKEIAHQKTEVIFLYSYSLNFPFSLCSKLIKLKLQADVRKRLSDLKHSVNIS